MGSQGRRSLIESISDGQMVQDEGGCSALKAPCIRSQLGKLRSIKGTASAAVLPVWETPEVWLAAGAGFPSIFNFHRRVKNWPRRMRKEARVKGKREKWTTTDTEIYKGMTTQAEEQPALVSWSWGMYSRAGGRKCPSIQSQRKRSTHGVDDPLQGLKAVVDRKHVILTVCDPGQLRTQQTRRQVRPGCRELRKATGSRGLHLLLEPRGPWGFAWAQGPQWKALRHNELTSGLSGMACRVGSSSYICFNTCLFGSRGKISQLENIWLGLMYLWIWGQAIGSFLSHSTTFLLATGFESNRLKFPFRVTLKISSSFGVGWGQWMGPSSFTQTAHWGKDTCHWFGCSCFKEQRIGGRKNWSVSFFCSQISA